MRKSELLKGITEMVILTFLQSKDMYGYELTEKIEKESEGYLRMKEGTLYPALKKLEGRGLIQSYWKESREGPRRKYYHLTEEGNKELNDQKKEWSYFQSMLIKLLFYSG
ncbi:DNA-binding PadR family transcriptional regulator [Peribacillus deserti]|uniref:DNA-binding PadR family transcriptional regulator n=1 Tax=Peribacillus deserti TaxID=673318 RepID=A0ABS2QDZ1_9BACI|nr:PadR family transcriptional regulator [Peribacillus deserti]MBM7691383.1 DNA-binding PadR family transcriptional regulator [Peribacillus deserti]